MAEQLSLLQRMKGIIGRPEPTKEQWLTSSVKPDFSRTIIREQEEEEAPTFDLGDRVLAFAQNQGTGFRPVTQAQKRAAKRAGEPEPTQGAPVPQNADRGRVIARLTDPVAGPKIKKYLDRSQELYQSNQEKFERLKNITVYGEDGLVDIESTMDNAKRFISEGLGYGIGEDGRFTLPEHGMDLEDAIYHGAPPGNSGQRSYQPGHVIQHLIDNRSRFDTLKNATDAEGVYKTSDDLVINEIPWIVASRLMDLMPDAGSWDGMGASGDDRFIDAGDMEYEFADGRFTGKIFNSPDDAYLGDNLDEIVANYSSQRTSRNRGIAILQKVLATAGVDGFSGSPDFISPLTGATIDHGVGVSESAAQGRFHEMIRNLVVTGSAHNKWKSGKSYEQVMSAYEDAMKGVVDKAGNYVMGEGEESLAHWLGDVAKEKTLSPGYIDQSEYFDGKRFLRTLANGGDIEDVINLPYQTDDPRSPSFHSLVKNESSNQFGAGEIQNVNELLNNLRLSAGLMSPGPRKNITGRAQEWAGDPRSTAGADNLKDNSLEFLRKAIFLNSLHGEEFRDHLSRARQEFGDDNESIKKYLDHIFDINHADPLKALMSAWSVGLTSHDQYVNGLGERGEGLLKSLKGRIPRSAYDLLAKNLEGEQSKYARLIQEAQRLDPDSIGDDRVINLSNLGRDAWRDNITPFRKVEDQIRYNGSGQLLKKAAYLFNSRHGRRALRDNGFGEDVDTFDEARNILGRDDRAADKRAYEADPLYNADGTPMRKSGRSGLTANDLRGRFMRVGGESKLFRSLLGDVLFDVTADEPTDYKLPENYQHGLDLSL